MPYCHRLVRTKQVLGVIGMLAAIAWSAPALANCEDITFESNKYSVCSYALRTTDIRVFWRDGTGEAYGSFSSLRRDIEKKSETLAFAMNAGMYHADMKPVGLYIENGVEMVKISTRRGPGNFHLQPNGVFYVGRNGATVMETRQYLRTRPQATFATQSGPMLVINGAIHPKFSIDSDSRKVRNGVGACANGQIVFAISDSGVTFYDFAKLFRDRYKCANALFLDGSISALYSPQLKRADGWRPMGPIVGVVEKKK
jgi:uncharacterized protein YigE (DUF2233 family)